MKITRVWIQVMALQGALAWAGTEIPVRGAYVPTHGYDDNDTIKVVIDGILPNLCYSEGQSEVTIDKVRRVISIRQFAERRVDEECIAGDANLPAALQVQTPFMAEALVGVLPKGDYRLRYLTLAGYEFRNLFVEKAAFTSVDSKPYAHVMNVFAKANIPQEEQEVAIQISGYLTSTCADIESIQVTLEDNIYTVLPVLSLHEIYCPQVMVPFDKIVKVRMPVPGRYLVHTRSLGGNARNVFFDVVN